MNREKTVKRAIALSGGGPVAGIELGALKAFEEKQIDFDIYSCACVGSWVGCLYNSLEPGKDRLKQVEEFFRDQIFIPDDIYESFPIDYKVFRMDYLGDYRKFMEKIFDVSTYQHLFLPDRIREYAWKTTLNPPKTRDELFYTVTEGLALHPFVRFCMELQYKIGKSGIAGLINSSNFVDKFINFKQLFQTNKIVYLNTYNLSENKMEIFINRKNHTYSGIDGDSLMAGSSVLHYTENKTINGGTYKYCEGAVVNTVNLDHLLTDHPDLDEIWVIKIVDYEQLKPPENLLESALVGVMLPFATISDNDIEFFSHKLRAFNRENNRNVRLINVMMKYDQLNYHWNHSNLEQGIKVGYEGTLKAIQEFKKNGLVESRLNYVDNFSGNLKTRSLFTIPTPTNPPLPC